MPLPPPMTGCCGTDPTDTRNGLPSPFRLSSHNRGSGHRYRHRHLRQCPSPLKYGYFCRASERHGPKSRLPPGMPDHFPPGKRISPQCLPALTDGQTPHNYLWNNKCLCCSFSACPVRYCGNPNNPSVFSLSVRCISSHSPFPSFQP